MRIPAVVGLLPGAVHARHRGKALPGADRLRRRTPRTHATRRRPASTMPASRPARARSARPPARRCCGSWSEPGTRSARTPPHGRSRRDRTRAACSRASTPRSARPVRARPAGLARRHRADARRGRGTGGGYALRGPAADLGGHRHRLGWAWTAPSPCCSSESCATASRSRPTAAARSRLPLKAVPVIGVPVYRRTGSALHAARTGVGIAYCAALALPVFLFESPLVLAFSLVALLAVGRRAQRRRRARARGRAGRAARAARGGDQPARLAAGPHGPGGRPDRAGARQCRRDARGARLRRRRRSARARGDPRVRARTRPAWTRTVCCGWWEGSPRVRRSPRRSRRAPCRCSVATPPAGRGLHAACRRAAGGADAGPRGACRDAHPRAWRRARSSARSTSRRRSRCGATGRSAGSPPPARPGRATIALSRSPRSRSCCSASGARAAGLGAFDPYPLLHLAAAPADLAFARGAAAGRAGAVREEEAPTCLSRCWHSSRSRIATRARRLRRWTRSRLTLDEGELVLVAGVSGSGKSTLLRAASGSSRTSSAAGSPAA